jgi:NAD(P)-dependent dehydrogenase (short-subunit alcohol dehydrogenase family)
MSESRKVAVITGASQGIGASLTAAFRDLGFAVVGTSRSILASDEADFVAVPGDLSEPGTARRVVDEALDRFGRIDTLINNAGLFIAKPFTEYTLEDYEAVTAVNLAGFFHITQRVLRHMVAQGQGHVVNVSTSLVDHAESEYPAALTYLTKGGLTAVSRALAVEYASDGVRVNAVALGVIKTPAHDPRTYEGMESRQPIGRVGDTRDVVDGIIYLEHAPFVTGETLHIDGGWAAGH